MCSSSREQRKITPSLVEFYWISRRKNPANVFNWRRSRPHTNLQYMLDLELSLSLILARTENAGEISHPRNFFFGYFKIYSWSDPSPR